MRIAQVVCVFPPYNSGIGRVAQYFAKTSGLNGQENFIFTPLIKKDHSGVSDEGWKLKRFKPLFKLGNGAFIPGLFFYLGKVDIIHLHYPFFGGAEIVWLYMILKRKKVKLIIHFHMDVPDLDWASKLLSLPTLLIKNHLFKIADAITCASLDYVKNSGLRKIYYDMTDKFYEIPFGVDEKFYFPKSSAEPPEIKKVIFIGGLDKAHKFKGIDILLTAFGQLPPRNLKLFIIGSGGLYLDYLKMAKDLNILDNVEFFVNLSDSEKAEKLRNAAVLVLPSVSSHEAFGLVLLEAMASGIPVITSDLPGVRSVFANGVQGLLAEPGNVADLKNKIEKILNNEAKSAAMGREGRRLVEKKYSLEKVAYNLNKLYLKIFNQNSA